MKLGLGTAQFGLDYGVSNRNGKTPASEVAAILRAALAHGIEVLDTAPLYGDSEASLGQALAGSSRFRSSQRRRRSAGAPSAPTTYHTCATRSGNRCKISPPAAYMAC